MDSEPQPSTQSSTDIQQSKDERKLPIKTYHCRFCSHLLIASTRELLSSSTPLRRRRRQQLATLEGGEAGVGGLDGALILELPSNTTTTAAHNKKRKAPGGYGDKGLESGIEEEEVADAAPAVSEQRPATATAEAEVAEAHDGGRRMEQQQAHYTIPLATLVPDSTPIIIRREDGFEKRVLLRCGRCRVVVGYKLCDAAGGTEEDVDGEGEDDDDTFGLSKPRKGERAIYLLPGSIVVTEDLDVGLTEPDSTGGAGEGRGEGRGDVLNAMIERNTVLRGMEREWMEWIK